MRRSSVSPAQAFELWRESQDRLGRRPGRANVSSASSSSVSAASRRRKCAHACCASTSVGDLSQDSATAPSGRAVEMTPSTACRNSIQARRARRRTRAGPAPAGQKCRTTVRPVFRQRTLRRRRPSGEIRRDGISAERGKRGHAGVTAIAAAIHVRTTLAGD